MTKLTTPRSDCAKALTAAGLSLLPPPTGVRYTSIEMAYIRETAVGQAYAGWIERRRLATQAVAARRARAA